MNSNLKISQAGLDFISRWEGCVLKPYKDVAGLRTIGVGHLIKPGENYPDGVSITKDQAYALLRKDVEKCENAIKRAFPKTPLTQNQFDALCSFGFNCGVGVYTNSSVAKALVAGKYGDVGPALLLWCKAKVNGVSTTVPGLLARRQAEVGLFYS